MQASSLVVSLGKALYGMSYAAFTHAGLTTNYRMNNLYKSIFVLSRSLDI